MNNLNIDNKVTILDNGLKIITIKKDTKIASLNIGIGIGSIYEKESERGLSHFIEHMLFKGTKNRDNEKLNRDLEFLGGDYNAYTDNSNTVYTISCLEEEIKNAIEILGDMLLNSVMDKDEIKKEQGVVLSEIKASKDDVEDLSFKRVNEFAFSKSPLRYDVLGTEETVKKFKRNDIVTYYNRYYRPNNATLVLVSSIDHLKAIDIIKRTFNSWSGVADVKIDVISETNKPGIYTTYKKQIEQNTVTYLYTLNDVKEEDEMPLKILNHKLGESANSILFRELRENRGLAYDVYTSLDLSKDVRVMNIFTAVSEESIDETVDVIDICIKKIKDREIKFEEDTLNLMKKIHKTSVLSTLEDSSDLCNYVLNQSLENRAIDEFIEDMIKLENLKKEDIYRVCDEFLNNPTIHLLKAEE
ncbi:MAG: M16 family metallopeptidase [Sarcina sp.]